jgi:hypothetical protein
MRKPLTYLCRTCNAEREATEQDIEDAITEKRWNAQWEVVTHLSIPLLFQYYGRDLCPKCCGDECADPRCGNKPYAEGYALCESHMFFNDEDSDNA